MVGNTFSNINKTNNYLSPQTITSHLKQLNTEKTMQLEIKVLIWDRHQYFFICQNLR